ncbi:MAG: dipeptidase [Bacillota bacterium]
MDLHCDTISLLKRTNGRANLYKNPFNIDILSLEKNKSLAQFFALFVDLKSHIDPYIYFKKLYKFFICEMKDNKDKIKFVKSFDEYQKNDKISAFLTIEDGGILGDDLKKFEEVYDLGIRLVTLTWNYENSLGCPNNGIINKKGLKPFGKKVIEWMNYKGIIIDVSHLSDGGFKDVVDISKKPFVASHSNARSICPKTRNLTDKMLKGIGNSGSVVGLNFYHKLLNDENISTVNSMVKHIHHMVNHAGIESVALGTDFDGVTGKMEISKIDEMYKLYNALKKSGFTSKELDKIWYRNSERILKEVL